MNILPSHNYARQIGHRRLEHFEEKAQTFQMNEITCLLSDSVLI